MLTLFIDESGCPGALRALNSQVQPLLVIAGIALDTSHIADVTRKYARLTQRYHHGQSRPNEICTDIQAELVKGSDVRRAIRANPTSNELKELALLDSVLTLMKTHGARLFGTVIVKREAREFDGRAVYMHALHEVVRSFHGQLVATDTLRTAIADFREAKLNGRVSVELMEAKLGPAGDQLPKLLHLPTFANSEVHVPLQIADLICSAIASPIAAHRFREELLGSPLLNSAADEATWRRFRQRLQEMIPAHDLAATVTVPSQDKVVIEQSRLTDCFSGGHSLKCSNAARTLCLQSEQAAQSNG